jgi:hypothetical protein
MDVAVFANAKISPVLLQKMERGDALSLSDLEELGRHHVPAESVVRYLSTTGTIYNLTANDIDNLRKAKVSDQVINYLLAFPSRHEAYETEVWIDSYPWWDYGWGYGWRGGYRHGYRHYR